MSVEIERLYQEKLDMYPHLKNIREKLWANEGKSRVSVMIGAGFSLNAQKIEGSMEGMAVWSDLKKRLIQDLSHHENIENEDVLDIGQIYVKEYGRSGLDEILKKAIPDENYEPDELHYQLLKLPWTDIYTTNYDTLLERAKSMCMSVIIKLYMILMIFLLLYSHVLLNCMVVFQQIDHLFLHRMIMKNTQRILVRL
ncbi:hypothetical protein AAHB64_23085 [Bacillus toyonensis]